MTLALLKFEFRYQSRQLAFWVFTIVYFLFGYGVGGGLYVPDQGVYNSAHNISQYTGLMSLTIVFPIMFQVVSGVLRDQQYHFSGILFSTPLKKPAYFISRFTGVFAFSLFVATAGFIGLLISASLANVDASRILDFDWWSNFRIWLMIILPTVFIMSCAIFTAGLLTRNTLATYMTAVLIYAIYWLCAMFLNSPMLAQAIPADPENLAIAALADPYGLSAFFEQTQFWTTYQKNYEEISFAGYFKWNRILWTFLSVVIILLAYKLFSFKHRDSKRKKVNTLIEKYEVVAFEYKSIVPDTNGRPYFWSTLSSLIKIEIPYVIKNLPFVAAFFIWLVIIVTEIYTRVNGGGSYSEKIYPTSGYLIELISEPLPFLALILIVFYSGDLVWRERQLKMFSMIDASPVSNIVLFLSKFITLLFIPLVLISSGILVAVLFQIAKGFYEIDVMLYFSMFYFDGLRLVVYTCLALFLQNLISNKYLGMLLTGLVILLFGTSLVSVLGIEHPMLQINRFPPLIYTEMTGFGDYVRPFHYFSFFWLSFGLLLMLVSFKLWRRGTINSFMVRLKNAFVFRNKTEWSFLSLAFILFLGSGMNIFYRTNIEQEFTTIEMHLDNSEAYEKKYKRFEHAKKLHHVAIKTEVHLFPSERKFQLKADYILQNKNADSVSEILLSERESINSVFLEGADLVEHDTLLKAWLFRFKEPVRPGEQVNFKFEINKQKSSLNTDRQLVNNGSYLLQMSMEPVIGYRPSREITDSQERKKRGLPKREEEEKGEHHLHTDNAAIGKVPFESVVSTEQNQTAFAPGDLIRSWTEKSRNFYHYKTSKNVTPLIAYISGEYAVQRDTFSGTVVEQWYHAAHEHNINKVAKYAGATLTYCNKHFEKYPYEKLRIVEIPGHWSFGGMAMPGLISMVSDRLYLVDVSDSTAFDLVAKRTIHEVGHQWWGHMLMPKNVEGGALFVEGFAKYTEAVVMEKLFGKWSLIQIGKTANRRYFSGRSFARKREPALYLSDGENYLSYGKMYTVMLALKELIGEVKVNQILRELVQKHLDETDPTVVSTELLDAFYEVTPIEYHSLIDDWFKKVITYDLKIEDSQITKLANGKFRVVLNINAKRYELQTDGSLDPIGINEPVTIGVFRKNPESVLSDSEIIYLKPHRINAEKMKVEILVDEYPKLIVLDPYLTRMDKNWVDNRAG